MLVDDSEVVRKQIRRLKLWGADSGFYIAEEAENGAEALEKLQQNPVELVITDIRMPKIDGIELLRRIRDQKLGTYVVFLSDYSQFDYAKDGIKYGAYDYLLKPVQEEDFVKLLMRVKEALNEKLMHEHQQEGFYPVTYIKQVIDCLGDGNGNALAASETLVDITVEAYKQDRVQTAVVLQRVLKDVWEGISASRPYIEKYMNKQKYTEVKLMELPNLLAVKQHILGLMQSIESIINKLECGKNKEELVRKVCSYTLSKVEEELTLRSIADALYLNKSYLSEVFKQKSGLTISEYILMVKLEHAKALMTDTELKNYEIAEKLSYKDLEYFSKLFKKYSGLSPGEFRRKFRSQQA